MVKFPRLVKIIAKIHMFGERAMTHEDMLLASFLKIVPPLL